jgi:hypothetical protein
MGTANYFKNLFLIGAIWNIGAAIGCSMAAILFTEAYFGAFDMPVPSSLFAIIGMFMMVLAYGIGYLIVRQDLGKNHGIVSTGVVGKIFFFINCVVFVLLKEANLMLLIVGFVDLLFAILFIHFLLQRKKFLL